MFSLYGTEGCRNIFSGFRLIQNKGEGRKDDLMLDIVGGVK